MPILPSTEADPGRGCSRLVGFVSSGGGGTPFAREGDIVVVRTQPRGRTLRLPFDCSPVKAGRNREQNIALQRGDVVLAP